MKNSTKTHTVHAPKKQPCPECNGWRGRVDKTIHQAKYFCSKCNLTFYLELTDKENKEGE